MKIKQFSFLVLLSISVLAQNNVQKSATPFQKSIKINTINTSTKEAIDLFSQEYNLGKNYTYNSLYSNVDNKNNSHQKFQQFYKNLKVEFGTVITHANNNGVYFVNGELYNAANVNTNATLTNQQALSKALENINATMYLWEDSEQAQLMNYEKPKGELLIFPDVISNQIHLAYKFDVYSLMPHKRQEMYIDAHSGAVLYSNLITKHVDFNNFKTENIVSKNNKLITATAATRYSGNRQIETTLFGANYVLQDMTRGNGVFTYNCETGGYQNVNFIDNDNNWTSAEFDNAEKDNAALDAHWGSEKTYDFWNTLFNRNSFDNNGAALNSYVHYGDNFANAFWNGAVMTYGDGNSNISPLTSIDVCAHEIGHAVCTYTANLVYQNESGAMNEGFSDIWGACVEQFGRTGSLNGTILPEVWLIAEDLSASPFRSMSNPNLKNDPDTYLGTFWFTGTGDNGGVHTNSGVLNHWFYIVSEGKSGTNNAPTPDTYNVTGIGMSKSAEISYLMERDYLTPNANYADARIASIEVANTLYCANSPEVIAVTNAWYAVNVGEEYTLISDDLALQTIENTATVSCGLDSSPILKLRNQGLNTITAITISYTLDNDSAITENWTGNLATCTNIDYPLSISGLTRGKHILTVTTTIINDGRPENNTKSVLLLANDAGTVGVINPFTTLNDALITYNATGTSSTWIRGIRTAGDLNTNGNTVYTTNLTGNYSDRKKSYIVSQCYDLTNVSNPQISFAMQYDLEINWDIVYVEYTTNFGQTWQVVGEMGPNWYNSDRTPQTSGNDCYNCVGAQWTGTNLLLTTYTYPLTAFIGQPSIIFRIVFHSDESVNEQGVTVDNFVISGVLPNENFIKNNISIYPNPSNGIYTLSFTDEKPTLIEVYDISGKIIITKRNINATNNSVILDLSTAAQGIYFVKIVIDNQQRVERIIKK